MLNLVYGIPGSGKTEYINNQIKTDLEAGQKVLLIVPEQQLVDTERKLVDITEDTASFNLEILSFRRLANFVFRKVGGLSYNYMTKRASALIMCKTLATLKSQFEAYADINVYDSSVIDTFLGVRDDVVNFGFPLDRVDEIIEKLGDTHTALKKKIHDLGLVCEYYEHLVNMSFDDPKNDIVKLAEKISDSPIFSDFKIYIDAFTGFTMPEIGVIETLINTSKDVTLALCMDVDDDSVFFENIKDIDRKIRKFATQNKVKINTVKLSENLRTKNEDIKFFQKHIWNLNGSSIKEISDVSDGIKVYESTNPYAEAEFVACHIKKRIRAGARYKDIYVVLRNPDEYSGIIDSALEKLNIPYFKSTRTDIVTKPIIKFIISAFNIYLKNWHTTDVISYVKTGLTGLTLKESDELETYLCKWSVSKRQWTTQEGFYMNPDGFTANISEKGKNTLEIVNSAREKIRLPLIRFFDTLDLKNATVKDITRALFVFLDEMNVRGELIEYAKKAKSFGDDNECSETLQIWTTLIEILDELVLVSGDDVISVRNYLELLCVAFKKTDIGKIPNTVDEVRIESSVRISSIDTPYVYVMGAKEGEFPMGKKDTGILKDDDKCILEELGIPVSMTTDESLKDEMFSFYKVISGARDSLVITYPASDLDGTSIKPSIIINRIKKLFSGFEVIKTDSLDDEYFIEEAGCIGEYYANFKNGVYGKALRETARIKGLSETVRKIDETKLITTKETVSEETLKGKFDKNINMTQARFEKYIMCPFSYYCTYVLKLTEKEKADFSYADVGNFIHHVLENFLKMAVSSGKMRTDFSEEEIDKNVEDIIEDYIASICNGTGISENKRLMHLFKRLRFTSKILIKSIINEFAQSEFTPAFFEYNIGSGSEEGGNPYEIPLSDGNKILVYGKIDRVDVLKKNNNVYVKIVDYKTGSKTLSANDVALGINLQMLLYLFSMWKYPSDSFKERFGSFDNVYPAGILYYFANIKEQSLPHRLSEEDIVNSAVESVSQNGLLLADEEILRAMESDLKGKYIPVKLNKDGAFSATSSVVTLEQFGKLMRKITDNLSKIGDEMKKGCADARPLKDSSHDACTYCNMKRICRRHSVSEVTED